MIKKIVLTIIFILLFFHSRVWAQTNLWIIDSFSSDITILNTGVVQVHEVIKVTFNAPQHGIYRYIPYRYTNSSGGVTTTEISNISTGSDSKSINKQGDFVVVKIGDPNVTFTGTHIYTINYDVMGVLRNYPPNDELYWNATGNDWEVPISSATATVHFPAGYFRQFTCYEGAYGSKQACDARKADNHTVYFASISSLNPGEGLTVVTNFPHGIVPLLHVQSFTDQLKSPLSLIVFLVTLLLGMGMIIYHWYTSGRDQWTKGGYLAGSHTPVQNVPLNDYEPVIVEYEPPEHLRPAEIGVLVDEKARTLGVTATIIDLAARGYLTITEKQKKWMFGNTDYLFTRTDKKAEELLSYEMLLLSRLFEGKKEVLVSSLKANFYQDLKDVKDSLYQEVVAKKLFPRSPEFVRELYLIIAVLIGIAGGLCMYIGITNEIAVLVMMAAGLILAAINTAIFSFLMPRRTAKGHVLYQRTKGYREFIEHVEKYRQQYFEKENMFNEVLPYAIVFGLTEKFAKALQDMGTKIPQPVWYYGVGPFNPILFTTSVAAFSDSLSSAMVATPKGSGFSSGGGFSGGGFGGGGGGSW